MELIVGDKYLLMFLVNAIQLSYISKIINVDEFSISFSDVNNIVFCYNRKYFVSSKKLNGEKKWISLKIIKC